VVSFFDKANSNALTDLEPQKIQSINNDLGDFNYKTEEWLQHEAMSSNPSATRKKRRKRN
jgi:hypothetical protein